MRKIGNSFANSREEEPHCHFCWNALVLITKHWRFSPRAWNGCAENQDANQNNPFDFQMSLLGGMNNDFDQRT
jgi:hypothetical protein